MSIRHGSDLFDLPGLQQRAGLMQPQMRDRARRIAHEAELRIHFLHKEFRFAFSQQCKGRLVGDLKHWLALCATGRDDQARREFVLPRIRIEQSRSEFDGSLL